MTKSIKGFITRDDFITPTNISSAPIYELSDISLTYSKQKSQHYSSLNALFSLYVFSNDSDTQLTQNEVNNIIQVVSDFNTFLTTSLITNKQQALAIFINNFNSANPTKQITNLNYNTIINYNNIKAVDYLSFTVSDVICNLWLSDNVFKAFYPDYDINIILPFDNFANILNNTSSFLNELNNFNLVDFNRRIELDKDENPTTYTKIMNIPYKIPNTSVFKDCYFGFNIYGLQGNYDHILKLELYNYLVNVLNIPAETVENLFPSILNINEFFITPRWDRFAIPSQVGEAGIYSQISSTYNEIFDLNKFVKIYNNDVFLKNNTYDVPVEFNNMLLQVTNGYYTVAELKDFKLYYNDLISISSTHPDFARMSRRTQRFVTLLENILEVANSNNSSELFNKVLANNNYHFTIITRAGVTYISYLYEDHQLYIIPKYEFIANV